MKYNPYSVSKIQMFNQCQYKFKLNYIDKSLFNIKTDNYYLHKGSHVHLILENNFDYSYQYPLSKEYNENHIKDTIKIVKKFEQSELGKQYKNIILNEQSTKEEKFAISEEKEVIDFNSSHALIRGSADLYLIKNNTGYIIDWKSGKNHKDDTYFGIKQGKMYAIYLFLKYPQLKEIKTIFVFIEHNSQKVITFFKDKLDNYFNDFLLEINTIENTKLFNQNISPLCNYCEFQKLKLCSGNNDNNNYHEIVDWF